MLDWLGGKRGGVAQAAAPAAGDTPQAQARTARERGNEHLAEDRLEQAAACFQQAAALDPTDAATLVNLGFALCTLSRGPEACECLQQAVALQPGNHDAHYFLGLAREQSGDAHAASASYARVIALKPDFETAYRDLVRVLAQSGQLEQAWSVLQQGLARYPADAELQFYEGNLHLQERRFAQAAQSFERAIALAPQAAQIHSALGQARAGQQQWAPAVSSYRRALALEAQDAQTHNLLGAALVHLGQCAEAAASFRQAVVLAPEYAEAHSNLGNALRLQGNVADAVQACEEAVRLQPSLASAQNNLGAACMDAGNAERALAAFDAAITLQPDYAEAHSNRGVVLSTLSRGEEALASHRRALALDPNDPESLNNQGKTLLGLRRVEEALASFDRALALKPGYADALSNRGLALSGLGRLEEALASLDAALQADPSHAEAMNNRGNVLTDLHRFEEALASYDAALRVRQDYAAAHFNRANALEKVARADEALASYRRALDLQPDLPFLYGNWLHAKMQACDWDHLDQEFGELATRVEAGQVFNPFTVIPTNLSAFQQRRAMAAYAQHQFPQVGSRNGLQVPPGPRRIRIGYFSADFHEHATTYLMAGLFEQHDRQQFELFAFSFGPNSPSAMRTRVEAAFDRFLVVNGKSDAEISRLARELGIDIAVDLKGYTQNARPGIFAIGAAPVQVNYLGFPGTMGAPFIDYLVADPVVIPQEHQEAYAEKIAYLPDSYQVNDDRRVISTEVCTRAEVGLPPQGFVFCCFNNSYKITPTIFDVWMRLLQNIDGSVLWLLEANPQAVQNLKRQAAKRGVAPGQLVFAGRMKLEDHLARHRLADLFLDTVYCNAHTTASDALWAGVPVLTCLGDAFPGRVAASLLRAVNLPDLVAPCLEDYERLARELATDPPRLAAIKEQLGRVRHASLFDTRRFAKHLESAYLQMAERSRNGLPPDHIHVAALPVPSDA